MACTKLSYIQELSKWNRYRRGYELKNFPFPWESFYHDASIAIENILVSHKRNKSLLTVRTHTNEKNGKVYKNIGVAARGQLHKETVYGKRTSPFSEEAFHVRKSIDTLTTEKQLDKVVDETIKKIILNRINQLGGFEKGNIPANTFFVVDENGIKKPQIFLPNLKGGDQVPILKVRVKENIGGAEKLKTDLNQWVNPRNNHHVLIYKNEKGDLSEEIVTFWTAVERKRLGMPVYQLPPDGKETLTTLQINDMFLLGLKEEDVDWEDSQKIKNHLYRVQKLSSKFYEFRLNTEASIQQNFEPFYIRIQSFGSGKTGWLTFNPIKVKISVSGKIVKI